jgi:hypothetical protein
MRLVELQREEALLVQQVTKEEKEDDVHNFFLKIQ